MRRAVFIERDALLDQDSNGKPGYSLAPTPNELARAASLLPLKDAGFVLIATANQPEISRGTLCRRELDQMHGLLRARLPLDDILICPHDEEDRCPCRKPLAGLFHEAAFKHQLRLGHSFVLSHRWQDGEAARVIGSTVVFIDSPWLGRSHRDFAVPNLDAAIAKVLERERLKQCVA